MYKSFIYKRLIFIWTVSMLFLTGMEALAQPVSQRLVGTPIGSANYDYNTGSSSSTVNTHAMAFDQDLNTYFASAERSRTWVGLDLGTPHVITRVGWCPRNEGNGPIRTVLGVFEGSNREDFLDALPLYVITEQKGRGQMWYASVHVSRAFRYVRYVGPNDARCNIAELQFDGYESEGAEGQYYQVTNLPTISIHTASGNDPQDKVTELEALITILYDGETKIQEYPITIRGRGNASWGFPKKPYRVKFADGSHRMFKGSAMESPSKSKKWTLINNYGDKTLMRNILAFETSRRLNMPYTTFIQPVDVILNGEYKGNYQLCDQITVDKNRVEITEMTPEDVTDPEITGGYLIEVDAYAPQEISWFTSNRGIPVTIKSPDDKDITSSQYRYIKQAFNLLESSLWSKNWTDSVAGYRSRLDVETFLRHFLVGEFAGNTDTYWSTYMYKDREQDIFKVGPVWDFDLAYNNDNRIYPINNRNDWVFRSGGSAANGMQGFVTKVLSDTYTNNRLKEIWRDMRQSGLFSAQSLLSYIDSTEQVLNASQRLNFMRWPILDQQVHCNPVALGSFEAEVQVLKDFIPERLAWIDEYLGYSGGVIYTDSTYYISTPEQLIEFSTAVGNGATGSVGYLTANIDMAGYESAFEPIGNGRHPFKGLFDGQNHTIKNLHISRPDNFTGLFGTVSGGVVIKRLILDETCSVSGGAYVGGIVGGSTGSGIVTLEALGNEASVTGTGNNAAGIIGCNYASGCTFTITNCYNTGHISGGSENGSISGWVGGKATLTNCWNIGTIEDYESGKDMVRGVATFQNCYSTNGSQVTMVSPEAVLNGELCYMLNEGVTDHPVWYEHIGVDRHPGFNPRQGVVYKDTDGTYYNIDRLVGDVNGDQVVDDADLDLLTDYLLGQWDQDTFQEMNADVNYDGEINLNDAVALVAELNGQTISFFPGTENNYLYSSNASVKANGQRAVNVWLSSKTPIVALQAELEPSEDLLIDPSSVTAGNMAKTHILKAAQKGNGIKMLLCSPTNATFSSQSGILLSFVLNGGETFDGGSFRLKGVNLIDAFGKTYQAEVKEYEVMLAKTYVTGIDLGMDSLMLYIGDTQTLEPTISPSTATVQTLQWRSSNTQVATVDDGGTINALAQGECEISATSTDGANTRSKIILTVSDPSGINAVPADKLKDAEIYTLQGMRIYRITQPGIYIVNGIKRYVKTDPNRR